MAHEPKLEIFKVYLNPKSKKTTNTFEELFESKYKADETYTPDNGFTSFFKDLLTTVSDDFYLNPAKKKGLGLEVINGKPNLSIKSNATERFIHGTLKGGRYGQNRSIGDIASPSSAHSTLDSNKIVLDYYYFLFYSPLKSHKGILMVQSYTDDTVNETFHKWLTELIKSEKFYFPEFTTFCPKRLQDEFRSVSVVKEMTFFQDIVLAEIEDRDSINTERFTVEISIKPKNEDVSLDKLDAFKKIFNKFGLLRPKSKESISLENFKRKIGRLSDGVHQSSFELDSDGEIKPTIYLRDRINLQPDGSPDWDSLHEFAINLLSEIKPEIYPELKHINN